MPVRRFTLFLLTAATLLAAACVRDPDVLRVKYVRAGDTYASKKRYTEAILEYRRAVQVAPKYGEARFKLAEAYAAIADIRNALPEYVRAADLMPENVELQVKAGNLLLLGGRFQDAKTRARAVLKQNPNDFRGLVLLGNALAGLRALDDAVNVAERAAELEPDRAGLQSNIGVLRLAQGERDLAEQAFKKAVAIANKNVGPYLSLANFYRSGGRLPEAEAALRKAYQLEPRSVPVNQALGSFLIEANRASEAEAFFKAGVEISKDASSRLALADYYLGTHRYAEATAVLNGLAAEKDTFTVAKMRLAVVQLAAGRRTEAFKSIDELLTKTPKDAPALAFKARLLLADFRIDEADVIIKAALAVDPRSTQVQITLGKVRAAQKRLEDARKAFNEALDLEPYGVDAALELAKLHKERGEIDTSISFAEKGIKNAPENLIARLTLVRSLTVRSEDYPRAEKEVRALLGRYPAQPDVWAVWGNICILMRDPTGARKAYDHALQLNPDSVEALSGLMALDAGANTLSETVKRIDARVAKNPNNAELLMLSAKTWLIAKDFARGEQLLKRAIAADAGILEAYVMLGQIYVMEGRLTEGTSEFLKIVSLDSQSIPGATMLGLLYNAQNKPDEALKWFIKASQIDPRAASVASNNVAWMYADGHGTLDEALVYARAAVSQIPENPFYSDTLGWILYKKEMMTEAVKAFQLSVNVQPENPTFQYHLGLATAAEGDDAKARRALEQALKLAPKAQWAADARKTLKELVY